MIFDALDAGILSDFFWFQLGHFPSNSTPQIVTTMLRGYELFPNASVLHLTTPKCRLPAIFERVKTRNR